MTPTHLKYSRDSDLLPKFIDISCGFSRSFGIDASGSIWAWGGGCLGFKEVKDLINIEIFRKRSY